MESIKIFLQLIGMSLLVSLIVVGGIASGVFIGKLIIKEVL